MTPAFLRGATYVLGLLGGVGQLAVAFLGFAIGGLNAAVVLLAFVGIVALVGVLLASRWRTPGLALMAIAGLGAAMALFSTTLLEIGVAALLLGAVAGGMIADRSRRTTNA